MSFLSQSQWRKRHVGISSATRSSAMTDDYQEWCKSEELRRKNASMPAYKRAGKNYAETHNKKYPKKTKARQAFTSAMSAGRIVRPDCCSECRKTCVPDGHHDDYAKHLSVRWLCRQCHALWHTENTALNGDEPVGMLDRFDRFSDKTFGDAAKQYLSEFEGKCKRRQEYALEPVLEYISDLPTRESRPV